MKASPIVKRFVKRIGLRTHIPRLFSHISSVRAVILAYHSVQPTDSSKLFPINTGLVVEPDVFEQQIKYVAEYCAAITMDDIADYFEIGKKLPPRSVAVTFDDGFIDSLNIAAPILNKYNVKSTVYLPAGCIDRRVSPYFIRLHYVFLSSHTKTWLDPISGHCWNIEDKAEAYDAFLNSARYLATWSLARQEEFLQELENILDISFDRDYGCCLMNWEQAKNFAQQGHCLGGHTVSHPNLIRIPLSAAEEEIHGCKRIIEEKTSFQLYHFAYPNPILHPNWNDKVASLIKQSGFRTSVTSDQGSVTKKSNPLVLKRISSPSDFIEFQWKLEMALCCGD